MNRMLNLLCSSRESALESIASSSRLNEISALTIWFEANTKNPFQSVKDRSPGFPSSVTDCRHAKDLYEVQHFLRLREVLMILSKFTMSKSP